MKHFQKGEPTFKCDCCNKLTRHNDEGTRMCMDCTLSAYHENKHSDNDIKFTDFEQCEENTPDKCMFRFSRMTCGCFKEVQILIHNTTQTKESD